MKKCKSGYVKKENKCIKRTINPATWFNEKKKKSYNPFKIWGSYIGVILGILIQYYFKFGMDKYYNQCAPNYGDVVIQGDFANCIQWIQASPWILFVYLGIAGILGFFLGYGIHSLIRRIRK